MKLMFLGVPGGGEGGFEQNNCTRKLNFPIQRRCNQLFNISLNVLMLYCPYIFKECMPI